MQNLLVVVTDKSQFKPVLGRVNIHRARARASVEVMDLFALDSSEIDRLIQGLDNTIVARNIT